MFRGSMKSSGYPLYSPVSPSLPLPCVTVRHHILTGLYRWFHFLTFSCGVGWGYISVPLWLLMDRMAIRWILDGRICFGTVVEWRWKEKTCPSATEPTTNSYGLPWNRTQFSAVRWLVYFYFFQYICVSIPFFSFTTSCHGVFRSYSVIQFEPKNIGTVNTITTPTTIKE